MIHAPTLQQDIIKASTNLAATPNSMHALMFAIYSMAVRAISDEECLSTYQDDKGKLITRYNAACQEALRRAEVLRSADVEVLRAFVLYLISAIHILDPRSLFALTAMADRIGRRLGLHSEAAYRRMSPLQGQLAKRVWWNILVYERRLAELSGAGPSILPNVWTARLPLNVNDSNLNATMTTPPKEQSVATDMIFCLTRFEVAEFLRAHRSAHTSEALWQEFGELNISDTEKDKSIDAFERRMEEKCDSIFTTPRGPRGAPPSAESLEYIFRISVEMLETYIVAINSKAVVHFDWYLSTNKPLIPLVHVLSILRTNTHGDLANRAWAAIMRIGDIFPRPAHSLTQVDNPMFLAFANLKVKAWEAREEYFRRSAPLPTPSAIANLKERLALRRKMMGKTRRQHVPVLRLRHVSANARQCSCRV
ncbi:hypothetical protein MRB53_041633 [Persea americana]|nr:hypothetical protein MRB53_041633 [Persea americana]